jgi:hypothetical protein
MIDVRIGIVPEHVPGRKRIGRDTAWLMTIKRSARANEPICNKSSLNLRATRRGLHQHRTGVKNRAKGRAMGWMVESVGRYIAHYLEKPASGYEPFTPSDADALRHVLRPGDVLLVEGNNHISGVIKYLTQSTWSHAALYVGPIGDRVTADGEPLVLVEANIGHGVVAAPLSKYARYHTRICRPTGLTDEDRARVCAYAAERIGFDYDLKNIIDLMRYLFPLPVPQRWRRRMIALGSGHPTRIICSALIAQAFETVRYPILPKVTLLESEVARQEILEIRHSSLYAPRDFDISPYFAVVKPTLERNFDYKAMAWADLAEAEATALVPAEDTLAPVR